MALLPRRTAIVASFAAALIGGAVVPASTAHAAGVPAPVQTGPADNTTTPLKDVVLTWNTVPGAGLYQVQISPNGEWTNNEVTLPNDGTTVNSLYEVPLGLPHGSYFWRVRAEVGTTWGAYSNARSFLREWEAPFTILDSPSTSDPTITWTPVQDASFYMVRFSTQFNFPTDPARTKTCFTHKTSFTPYDLTSNSETDDNGACFGPSLPGGGSLVDGAQYYWQVVPYDGTTAAKLIADTENDSKYLCDSSQPECDADYFTSANTFTYSAHNAGSPSVGTVTGLATTWHTSSLTPTSCDSTTACPITPTLSWTPVSGANFYHVQIFRDPDGTNTYRAYDTAWPELTPRDSFFDGQAGKTYYWNVTAGTCETMAATFCDSSQAVTDQIFTVYQTSTLHSFAKASSPVNLTAPANGATLHGRSVTFNWTDFQNTGAQGTYDARNYELQVSTTADFATPLIDDKDIDMTQFTDPASALADGTYFWRVAPIDDSSNVLTWSAIHAVTVNATGPTVAITSKDGVDVKGPITIHFSEAISGVSKSTVQVVPADGGPAVAGKLKLGSSSTVYEFTPKKALVTGQTYNLSVSPTLVDGNGNSAEVVGDGVRTSTVAADTSKGWSYSSGWIKHKASGARSGSYVSAKSGSTATLKVVGSKATLYGCKGPDMGKLAVTLSGQTQTVSEHQSFTKCGVAIWHRALPPGETSIKVKVTKGTGNIDQLVVK